MNDRKGKTAPDRRGPTFCEQLRDALAVADESLYSIAGRAEVPRSALTRFVSRERSLGAESFGRIAEALGFRLVGGPARRVHLRTAAKRRPKPDAGDAAGPTEGSPCP